MGREQFVENVRDYYFDKDKEKAVTLFDEIKIYIYKLREDVNLNAKYEGLNFSGLQTFIEVKHRKLKFNLEENEIEIRKIDNEENRLLDKIVIENEVPKCKHGEFTVDEIDKYITECFNDLF